MLGSGDTKLKKVHYKQELRNLLHSQRFLRLKELRAVGRLCPKGGWTAGRGGLQSARLKIYGGSNN